MWGSNIQRGLMKSVCRQLQPNPSQILANVRRDSCHLMYYIQPAAWLHFLSRHYPAYLRRVLGCYDEVCDRFWHGLKQSPAGQTLWREHSFLRGRTLGDMKRTIPVVFHQDSGPFSKTQSVEICNFSSIIAIGADEWEQKMLIASAIKVNGAGRKPASIIRSFESLTGLRFSLGPSDDASDYERSHAGELIIEFNGDGYGWRLMLLFSKLDGEVVHVDWGCPGWKLRETLCMTCPADRTAFPYTDLIRTAALRANDLFSKSAMLARCTEPLHPMLNSAFFSRFFVFPDLMHMADCEGVIANAIGCTLAHLITCCIAIGSNQTDRLAWLNSDLTIWYAGRNVSRVGVLKKDNIFSDTTSFPTLHGPAIKSAATRNLLPWCVEIAEKLLLSGSQHDESVKSVLRSLDTVTNVLYSSGFFLRPAQQQTVTEKIAKLARHWQFLAAHSEVDGSVSWHVTHKLHGYMHVPFYSSLINMRFVQNYLEEGLVGKIAQVYISCKNGPTGQAGIQQQASIKYLVASMLRCEGYKD